MQNVVVKQPVAIQGRRDEERCRGKWTVYHDDLVEREGAVYDVALVEEGHDLGHLVADLESAVQGYHPALPSRQVLHERQLHHLLPPRQQGLVTIEQQQEEAGKQVASSEVESGE